jgi:hypothetical protein
VSPRWLKKLGLEPAPPPPEQWVPLVAGRVDDAETGFSRLASGVAGVLKDAGIDAQQRPYVVPDQNVAVASWLRGTFVGPSATERIRIAVLVHYGDLEQARQRIVRFLDETALDAKPDEGSDADERRLNAADRDELRRQLAGSG